MDIFSFIEGIYALQATLFVIGLLLLIVEMFIPGFGIAGGIGLLFLVLGIILTARTPFEAFVMVIILVLLIVGTLAVIMRSAKRGKLSRKLILWSSAKQEEGFSTSEDKSMWVGKVGISLTVLRPAGAGEFEDQRLDVVTDGTFIDKGIKIKIVRTEGRRIVVEPVK